MNALCLVKDQSNEKLRIEKEGDHFHEEKGYWARSWHGEESISLSFPRKSKTVNVLGILRLETMGIL